MKPLEVMARALSASPIGASVSRLLPLPVLELSHRVVVLNEGEVIAAGSPREAMREPRVVDVYLGKSHVA